MLKSLYTTATGMKAQQTMVDMIANNIANVNTAGFKKSQASFEDLLYVTIESPGLKQDSTGTSAPIGLQIGSARGSPARPRSTRREPWKSPRGHWTSPSTETASSRSSCPTATPATRAMVTFSSTPMARSSTVRVTFCSLKSRFHPTLSSSTSTPRDGSRGAPLLHRTRLRRSDRSG